MSEKDEEKEEGFWKRKYEELHAEKEEEVKKLKADLAAEARMRESAEQREETLLKSSVQPARVAHNGGGDDSEDDHISGMGYDTVSA